MIAVHQTARAPAATVGWVRRLLEHVRKCDEIVAPELETGQQANWQHLHSMPGLHSPVQIVGALMKKCFKKRFVKVDHITNFPLYPNREINTYECTPVKTDRFVSLVERSDGKDFFGE